MEFRTLDEAEAYLNEVPKFTEKHSIEATREYLDLLGAPDRKLKVIHVAGTNGKGSVCCYLTSILQQAGLRVGLFTSPHLVRLTERIRIGDAEIGEEDFLRLFHFVLEKTAPLGHPSYFELLFLICMLYFAEKEPDIVVLETGLGGRLDATNSVRSKLLTVITRIGIDHVQYLGTTIPEIAGEKAGILMEGVPCVCLAEPSEAAEVIAARAAALSCPLYTVKRDEFHAAPASSGSIDFSFSSGYDIFGENSVEAEIATGAVYQGENASLASLGIFVLENTTSWAAEFPKISAEVIGSGLCAARWPGRMEELEPGVIIDGGHNPDGIRAFLQSVHAAGRKDNLLLFSAVGDKDTKQMAEAVKESGLFRKIAASSLYTSRTLTRDVLTSYFGEACVFDTPGEALAFLKKERREGEIIYAAGSLYLVGELKAEK